MSTFCKTSSTRPSQKSHVQLLFCVQPPSPAAGAGGQQGAARHHKLWPLRDHAGGGFPGSVKTHMDLHERDRLDLTKVTCVCSLPGLLQELEDSKEQLGITSYGLTVTTLEEVFLAVSAAASEDARAKQRAAGKLHAGGAPAQNSASSDAQKAEELSPDAKVDAEPEQGEQQPAEKLFKLMKVRYQPQP